MVKAGEVERILKRVHLAARRVLLSIGEGCLSTDEVARRESILEDLWLDLDGPVGIVYALKHGPADRRLRLGAVLQDCLSHLRAIYGLMKDIEAEPAVCRFIEEILRPGHQTLNHMAEEEGVLGKVEQENLTPLGPVGSNSDRLFLT